MLEGAFKWFWNAALLQLLSRECFCSLWVWNLTCLVFGLLVWKSKTSAGVIQLVKITQLYSFLCRKTVSRVVRRLCRLTNWFLVCRFCSFFPRWSTPPTWATRCQIWSPTRCTNSPSWWPKAAVSAHGAWQPRAPPLRPVGALQTRRHKQPRINTHSTYMSTKTRTRHLRCNEPPWLAQEWHCTSCRPRKEEGQCLKIIKQAVTPQCSPVKTKDCH